MRRIDINGRLYGLPFEHLLRPLTADERDRLRADITEHGIQQDVITASTPSWGYIVVDGIHRGEIGGELDLEVPVRTLGPVTDAFARRRCLALNLVRRHLSPEELSAARCERVGRVAARRSEGVSMRKIAREEKVSESQVRRDLQVAGAPYGAPDPSGARKARRTPTPLDRTRLSAMALARAVRQVLKGPAAARLAAIAQEYGQPTTPDGWPALDTILAVIRDLTRGGASG